MKKNLAYILAASILLTPTVYGASSKDKRSGTLTDPLADSLWNKSEWISAKDAPIVTHVVTDPDGRAADAVPHGLPLP